MNRIAATVKDFFHLNNQHFLLDSIVDQFHRLIYFRWAAIIIEIIVAGISSSALHLNISLPPIIVLIIIHAGFNLSAALSLRRSNKLTEQGLFITLTLDTLILSGLLYFSGGSSNPFVSLLLLPLITVASILPRRYVLIMAVLSTLSYTLLMFYHAPLTTITDGTSAFSLHVIGMWFGFLLATLLVVFFISKMAASLRESEQNLSKIREQSLQDEHMVAIGTLATAAAHELGTPLSTISVITNDLKHDYAHLDAHIIEKTNIITQQLERCKNIISDISARNESFRAEEGQALPLNIYLHNTLEQWRATLTQDNIQIDYQLEAKQPNHPMPVLFVDKRLTQSLINLFNNAADESNQIKVHAQWSEQFLELTVSDQGKGIPQEMIATIGTPFFTTKSNGQGLGIFLARSVIERYKGTLKFSSEENSGTQVSITLPLEKLICHE